jgi:serine/threonine-protein kinase
MSGKVKLEVTDGPMKGRSFAFYEHDTFLFGRMSDCHACLPEDKSVSRHHFILEANPPDARISDLGSMNGTHVNDVRHGGRKDGETPEEGARRQYPAVDLKNGDHIRVGETVLAVQLEAAAICSQCNVAISDQDRPKCAFVAGAFICPACNEKIVTRKQKPIAPEPVTCQKCGKDVTAEIGKARRGDYLCQACREEAKADPAAMLMALFDRLGAQDGAGKVPEISGYEIEKKLGAGGFGAVYLGRRKKDNQFVAIKVMLSRVAVDERARRQLLKEIELTRPLRHNHIVTLLSHGSAGGAFYFIMDYCEGGSISDLMKRCGGKLPVDDAGPLMLEAMDGLIYIHANGIVHRDLKPANILLSTTQGKLAAKISDLGLAKNFEKAGLSGMTITGAVAGTARFMPREQVVNFKYVKEPTDVWGIGATFYNMLTGKFPRDFPQGRDQMEIVLQEDVVPISKRDSRLPKKLADVIDRAIADKIDDRYQTAAEMRKALAAVL